MENEETTKETEQEEPQSLVGDSGETTEGEWMFAEGYAGVGDKPEYLKENFKSVSAQAEAYVELEKKFGSFTGAPKDGYELPENLDKEDALVEEVMKFGTEHNMSQDGFNQLMELAMAQAEVTKEFS